MANPVTITDVAVGTVKSKTAWFAALIILLGTVQTQVDLVSLIGEKNSGVVLSVIGVVVYILRALTKDTLASKA